MFLKALGLTSEKIEEFAGFESIALTLEKDNILTKEEALKDIYRKLRPGEQVAARPRVRCSTTSTSTRSATTSQGRPVQINNKLGLEARSPTRC